MHIRHESINNRMVETIDRYKDECFSKTFMRASDDSMATKATMRS